MRLSCLIRVLVAEQDACRRRRCRRSHGDLVNGRQLLTRAGRTSSLLWASEMESLTDCCLLFFGFSSPNSSPDTPNVSSVCLLCDLLFDEPSPIFWLSVGYGWIPETTKRSWSTWSTSQSFSYLPIATIQWAVVLVFRKFIF